MVVFLSLANGLVDFKAWQEALDQICPSKSMATPVGEFVHPSHRLWKWKWCPVSNQLKHISNALMEAEGSSRLAA